MKIRAMERNFRKIKNEFHQIEEIVKHTKINALWEHEAAVRKKLKALKEYEGENISDFQNVYENYLQLLDYISRKLIEDYNRKNNTAFNFKEIIEENYQGYLKSGVINILITKHIPEVICGEFDRVFPENPKDEYKSARLVKRKFYLHLGDTNTGKTYNAMQRLKGSAKGVYLSPLRILALENYERLNNEGVKCSLITGEEEIMVEGAQHICSTIEKLNLHEKYDVGVIDEIQMINDDQRGAAWTRAILGLKCSEIHVCGALNAEDLIVRMIRDCGDDFEIIEYNRDIPLIVEDEIFSLKHVQDGDALVAFSKKKVLQLAYFYSNIGIKTSIIYGDLPPEVRKKQYKQFIDGETSILISTDAIGMGVNLPIKRIIFMDIKKFDGNDIRYLNSQEVKQIAGRAGRKGIYDEGYVSSSENVKDFLRENLEIEDDMIESGVVGPSEEILTIGQLSLREKLALWSTTKGKVKYYRKMDVTEYLVILDNVKQYKLDQKIQWKLLKIPFDVTNADMMKAFLDYMDELFIAKSAVISLPQCMLKELYDLELYYQKINLYYSFSKVFNLEFDALWVYEERVKVSEDINKLLLNI